MTLGNDTATLMSEERLPERFDDLTGARFAAALSVVVFHLAPLSPLLFKESIFRWIAYGKSGVSFFFILSGFVLAYTYADWFASDVPGDRYRQFLQNRFARIFPAHAVVMLLLIPLIGPYRMTESWLVDPAHPAATLRLLAWTWLVNFLLVQIYVPDYVAAVVWNVPAWSIDCEVFFYAVFPLLAWGIGRRLTTPGRLLLAGLATYAVEAGMLAFSIWWIQTSPSLGTWSVTLMLDYASHLPHLRLWEFLIGVLAGTYVRRRHLAGTTDWLCVRWRRDALLVLALTAVVTIMAVPGSTAADRLSKTTLGWYVLFTPAFTLIILILASGRTWLSRLLSHPWMLKLGEASYALYLVHWSAILIDKQLQDAGWGAWRLGFSGSLVYCSLAALALHRWVELPARQRLRATRPPAAQPVT